MLTLFLYSMFVLSFSLMLVSFLSRELGKGPQEVSVLLYQ